MFNNNNKHFFFIVKIVCKLHNHSNYFINKIYSIYRHFHERFSYNNEKVNPLSGHIFSVGGKKWKFLRTKLTPTFTSGKMKLMFHTIIDSTTGLIEAVNKHAVNATPVDIKEVLGCFTTDIIGSCAFGLECNSFIEQDADFRRYGRKIFAPNVKGSLKTIITMAYPNIARKLNVKTQEQDIDNFFINVVENNYNFRVNENFVRNDFFQLLIDIKKECELKEEKFSIENLAAQCFLFFIAGFETSSTATTFTLYELAKNTEIQDKVRQEIRDVLSKHNGEMTYEAIQEMKYLRCVLDGKSVI